MICFSSVGEDTDKSKNTRNADISKLYLTRQVSMADWFLSMSELQYELD